MQSPARVTPYMTQTSPSSAATALKPTRAMGDYSTIREFILGKHSDAPGAPNSSCPNQKGSGTWIACIPWVTKETSENTVNDEECSLCVSYRMADTISISWYKMAMKAGGVIYKHKQRHRWLRLSMNVFLPSDLGQSVHTRACVL